MRLLISTFVTCSFFALPSVSLAHYLWIDIESPDAKTAVANIYFEESPKPGDGHYLNHFLGKSDVWIRTIERPNPAPVRAAEVRKGEDRWMRVEISAADEISVDAYGKFGVYAYDKTNVLLHYYARHLSVSSHDAMHELGRAEQMKLDLVAHEHGDAIEFKLLWNGQPVADRMVFIRGPKGFRQNLRTDARGEIEVPRPASGTLTLRSSVEEQTPGEEDGEAYEFVRHNITLVMPVR